MNQDRLARLLHAFFEDHLKCQKGLQSTSIRSYRDALRLFLLFVADDLHHKLTRLTLADLTADRVRRFLAFLERVRHNQVRTRNQRLAAVRGFFEYLATCDPQMLLPAQQVSAIPIKRTAPSQTMYLEIDEIQALFAHLPSDGPFALRDHALLLFLYNTGARAQEVADLRAGHLVLDGQAKVRLHGLLVQREQQAIAAIARESVPATALGCPRIRLEERPTIDALRDLQSGASSHRPFGQKRSRWQAKGNISAPIEARHCRPSTGGRSGNQRHSGLARPCQFGDHESICGDQSENEGGGTRGL